MTDTSSTSPDPLRAWREATGGSARPTAGGEAAETAERSSVLRPRLTLLVVLAAVVCVAALGLASLAAGRAGTSGPPGATVQRSDTAVLPATVMATPPTALPPPAVADDLAAAAVLSVRSAAPRHRYVDTAVAEAVHQVGEVTIVVVRALVLHATADGWDGGRQARYAVPVERRSGTALPLARPWALAMPAEAEPSVGWEPVDSAAVRDLAAEALAAQGYRLTHAPRLRSSTALPGILQARVRAIGPTEDRPSEHLVWVSADNGAVVGATTGPTPTVPAPPGPQP